MAPLFLKSEEALCAYLKKFLKQKTKAVQLDGATHASKSTAVVVVFEYSVNDQKYKLLGDTSRKAIEKFVDLAEEHGSAGVVLKEHGEVLVLNVAATDRDAAGWHCAAFIEKANDSFDRAA